MVALPQIKKSPQINVPLHRVQKKLSPVKSLKVDYDPQTAAILKNLISQPPPTTPAQLITGEKSAEKGKM
jgi:hypothetical protein